MPITKESFLENVKNHVLTDKEHLQNLKDIDAELKTLERLKQRALEHRREYIHRNSLNKNPACAEYLSRMDD